MNEHVSPALPLPRQIAWQDYELGVLYSFDIPVYLPQGWQWTPAYTEPVPASAYNPVKLDTDQWLQSARDLGARYAIFTATHMGGFLQWQSDAYPYGLRQSPWRGGKGDVVRDFIESCRRTGVAPGLFLSWRFNAFWGLQNMRVNFGKGGDDAKQAAYEVKGNPP